MTKQRGFHLTWELVCSTGEYILYLGNRWYFYTDLAVVQHHDPVAAHHGVEAVGDDESGAAAKGITNGLLDQMVCLIVNGRCRLIQQQDLGIKTNYLYIIHHLIPANHNLRPHLCLQCLCLHKH